MDRELELAWGTLQQATLPQLIDLASEHGFAAIAITPRLYHEAVAAGSTPADLRARLTASEVRVTYVDGLASALPGATATSQERGEEDAVRVAEAVGASAMNVMHYRGPPDACAELDDAVAGLVERLAAHGLRTLLEFLPGTGIGTLDRAAQLAAATSAEVMLDTLHLHRSGGSARDLTAETVARIGATQVSDWSFAQDSNPYVSASGRLMPGDGDLDLVGVLAAVLPARAGVPLGIEVFSDELRDQAADAVAARSARALRSLLDVVPSEV